MIVGTLLSVLLVCLTIGIHYEALSRIARQVERFAVRPRRRIMLAILLAFAAHTLEVYLFAVGYWAASRWIPGAGIEGAFGGAFSDFLYFSATSYTTIGFGEIWPTGALRLVAGTEGLTGLVMITWTASFTYLMMERYWRRE